MAHSVVILDEEQGFPFGAECRGILRRQGGYDVDLVHMATAALSKVTITSPQVVIPILPAVQRDAEALLLKFRAKGTGAFLLPVVTAEILTDVFDVLVHCSKDFLMPPLRELEVCARVRRLLDGDCARPKDNQDEQLTTAVGLTPLIGDAPVFKEMKRKISRLAASDCNVLISGETGTGKELCARALHYLSSHAPSPFLPVNCGAIPAELFESEFFGHKKGAFTGAWCAQAGLIAEAEGGTLLLDEIETLSLTSQAKLLRFLQDQTYHVVGSPRQCQANVRIIASTNVELRSKIDAGAFREDLYQRLAVIRIDVPPLRQRTSDIPLLAAHFWSIYTAKADRPGRRLSAEAVEVMSHYPWPGNVRELQNLIQNIALLGEDTLVRPEHLPISRPPHIVGSKPKSFTENKALAIQQFEKAYIAELLLLHQGNVTRAAEYARKDRRALGRLIKKYGITKH